MTEQTAIQHGILKTLFLHLFPGLVMLVFYIAIAPMVIAEGYPPIFGSILTIPVILVPWMLGYLALEGKRLTGRYNIMAAVSYREKLPAGRYAAWSIALIVWGVLLMLTAGAWLTPALASALHGWLPEWFLNSVELDMITAMPRENLIIFLVFYMIFVAIVAPWIEELYFRGNLMPALSRMGIMAPVLGTLLFTIYHFESLWENPVRFLMVLPLSVAVWKTRSVNIGIIVHVALNTLGGVALIIAVLAEGAP
jgi:uncharacterized protein